MIISFTFQADLHDFVFIAVNEAKVVHFVPKVTKFAKKLFTIVHFSKQKYLKRGNSMAWTSPVVATLVSVSNWWNTNHWKKNIFGNTCFPCKAFEGSFWVKQGNIFSIAVFRSGQVEEFDADQSKWTLTASAMFDSSTPTLYVLPMPMDRYMYILRAFSSGYSFEYSSHSFSLHRLDTVHGSHRKLSQIEASDLELVENEHMFGYSIKPGQFTLTNELGRPRVVYNLVEQSWTTSATPTKPPAFIGEVWGSVPWQDRVYFVGRTKSDAPIFMFYDVTRERFKATVAPPSHLSGVICHMVADRTQLSQNLMT